MRSVEIAINRKPQSLCALVGLIACALLIPAHPRISFGVGIGILVLAFVASEPKRAGAAAFGLYLVPLFALGRVYSYVGISPIFLPEVVLVGAILITAKTWWPAYRDLVPGWYKFGTGMMSLVAALATYRGISSGYAGATKGLIFVLYPALSGPVGAWIVTNSSRWSRILTLAAVGAPLGLSILSLTDDTAIISSAFGFYLAGLIAVATSREPGWPRTALFGAACAGVLVLGATGRRGPFLAVVIAMLTAQLTAGRTAPLRRHAPFVSVLAGLTLAATGLGALSTLRVPGVAATVQRVHEGFTDPGSASEANVALRFELWRYSLGVARREGPLLGTGFGRPFAVQFRGADLAEEETGGPHNSFVGVAYYMGYPMAILFLVIVGVAFRQALDRALHHSQPTQVIWLAGGIVTALTNVAMESPYIGGPMWILLGWCVTREQSHRSQMMTEEKHGR